MNNYYLELTDLYCGELNYSFIKRYTTKAKSIQGAISKLSKITGLNFRADFKASYEAVYHSTTKLTGAYVEEYELNDSDHISTQTYSETI
tara:strand:+ start:817 stop:1086 length:270 start_codon:yes stop_codon:yes gene_type:complete